MFDELPNDADGDALRRLIRDGSDITRPMTIDFAMDVPDGEWAAKFAPVAQANGFETDIWRDDESGAWTCNCTCTMVPSYAAMIEVQELLAVLGRPYQARPDGWGSFGNAQA